MTDPNLSSEVVPTPAITEAVLQPPVDHLEEVERQHAMRIEDLKVYGVQAGAAALALTYAGATAYAINKFGGNYLTSHGTSHEVNAVIRTGTAVGSLAAAAYAGVVGPIISVAGTGAVVTAAWDRFKARKNA